MQHYSIPSSLEVESPSEADHLKYSCSKAAKSLITLYSNTFIDLRHAIGQTEQIIEAKFDWFFEEVFGRNAMSCGQAQVEFFNQNQVSDSEKTDSLDSDLFLVEDSNEVSFTVKQTSDLSKIGRYEIGYKVWYTS